MVNGQAVWYVPVLDFSRYVKAIMTRFIVTLPANTDVGAVSERIQRVTPGLSHIIDTTKIVPSAGPAPSILDVGALLDSVGQAEDVQRELSTLEAVEEVEVLFPRRVHLYRSWFDEHLETKVSHQRNRFRGARIPSPSGGGSR